MATASGVERKKNWTTRTLFFIVSLLFVWACFGLRGWGLGFFFSNNFCSWGSWKRLKRFEMMETETKTNESIFRHVFWLFFFVFFLHFQPTFCEFVFVVIPIVRSFIHLAWRDEKKREIGKASKRKSTKKTKTNQPTNKPPPHPPIWAKRKKKKTQTTHKKKWNSKWKKRTTQTKHARFVSTWPLDWRWWLFF